MRLVIDLQGAQATSLTHGTGGHSMSLAQTMAKLKGEHEIIIALNGTFTETIEPIRAAFDALISQDCIRVWSMPSPALAAHKEDKWRRRAAEILREEFLASLQPDIVHVTGMFEGFDTNAIHSIGVARSELRTAVTVYQSPPSFYDSATPRSTDPYEVFYRAQLQHLKRADFLLSVTSSAKTTIGDRLGIAQGQCASFGAAAAPQFVPGKVSATFIERIKKRLGITRSMVMCADAAGDKNNLLRLIKAFSLLPPILRKSHQLVVVEKNSEELTNEFEKTLQLFGLSPDCVIATGEISADALIQLYRSCVLFVAPALAEDAGFATLEAMSCGAPVIGANTPSGVALIDHPAALFDPLDSASIFNKMAEVLYSERQRDALIVHGLAQAKKFNWEQSGLKALGALEKWADSSPSKRSKGRSVAVVVPDGVALENDNEVDQKIIQKISAIRSGFASEQDWLSTSHAIAFNHPASGQPKLLVDLSELVYQDPKTGIQRVVRSILSILLTNPPAGYEVRPVYLCRTDFVYKYAEDFICKFLNLPPTKVVDEPAIWSYKDVFFGLDYQRGIVLEHQALYDKMRLLGVKVYFIVHDLLPISMPKAFQRGSFEEHERWLNVLARHDGIVAVSRTVADEIIDWLAFTGPTRSRPLKVGWFHHGADLAGSVPSKGLPADAVDTLHTITSRQAFLLVGTIEPRKGQLQTLAAFELLWEQGVDVNLVIVGKHGWSVDLLIGWLSTHRELGKRLFWLEAISDEYLDKVYASCVCLIAPSEGEGFGLPLIEAAKHGLPIIARDIPVFHEVAGAHATYFANKLDCATISESVKNWLDANARSNTISNQESASNRAKEKQIPWQTWKQSAEQLMAVVLGGNWYKTSSFEVIRRYWASSEHMKTIVGKRSGHQMMSAGEAGYLLYGPYIRLPRGLYRVSLTGSVGATGADGAFMEAACDIGAVVLGKVDVLELEGQVGAEQTIASLDVVIEDETPDFEIRLEINALSSISVSMLVIEPLGGLPEANVGAS
jgi:glycosyltransferase involved in cell wall biosynthesis